MAKYARYAAKAVSIQWAKSPLKQTTYVEVIFEVVPTAPTAAGAQFPWKGYFTENTKERSVDSLKTMGCTFPGGDITNTVGFDRNTVSISVEDTEYGPEVTWVNAPGSVRDENRLAGADLKSFASSMKGTLLRLGATGGGTKPTASAAPAPWDGQGAEPEQPPINNGAPSLVEPGMTQSQIDDSIPF